MQPTTPTASLTYNEKGIWKIRKGTALLHAALVSDVRLAQGLGGYWSAAAAS
jgi:hypothetical protein